MHQDVLGCMRKLEDVGRKQHNDFVSERILSQEKQWTSPIPRNNFPQMDQKIKPAGTKSDVKIVKEDRMKTIQLLHAVHAGRGIDKEVFSHEISENPPALTKEGLMYKGSKSDVLGWIGANLEACNRH